MGRPIDLTGQKFGRLTVISKAESLKYDGYTIARWSCVCDCGKHATVTAKNLRSGSTTSCGCYRSEYLRNRKGSRHHSWVSDDSVSYATHHARLTRSRGKASEQACVDCGDPAASWSYRKGCPDERTQTIQSPRTYEPMRAKYCPHLDCYDPRCVRCHLSYDTKKEVA